MRLIIFRLLAIVGVVFISVLSFVVPKDPFEIIPAMTVMSFDKPVWFCIMFCGSFIYLIVLYSIYDYLDKRKIA